MQKKVIYLLVVLSLLLAALPSAVFAATAQEFEVTVYNRTGHPAEVKVTDADGVPHMFTAPAGISSITLPEGMHSYWVSSACGNSAGRWNLNVDKKLWIDCSVLGSAAWLTKTAKASGSFCADTGLFFFVPSSPPITHFYSQTNWSASSSNTWDQELALLQLVTYATIVKGCVTDYSYDAYFTSSL